MTHLREGLTLQSLPLLPFLPRSLLSLILYFTQSIIHRLKLCPRRWVLIRKAQCLDGGAPAHQRTSESKTALRRTRPGVPRNDRRRPREFDGDLSARRNKGTWHYPSAAIRFQFNGAKGQKCRWPRRDDGARRRTRPEAPSLSRTPSAI